METFEKKTGIKPVFGGYHSLQGTKNALVQLDEKCYLEFLAIDDSNLSITPPRWMGVDLLTKDRVTRIALKSENLQKDYTVLQQYKQEIGPITGGSRKTASGNLLKWEMIMPLATPEVSLVPFFVDWSGTESHPSSMLPVSNCRVNKISCSHPQSEDITTLYEALSFEIETTKASAVNIELTLSTPKGKIIL